MEILKRKLFIGTMQVIVILPPAQEERIDAEHFGKPIHDRNASTGANKNRSRPKTLLNRFGSRAHKRTIE